MKVEMTIEFINAKCPDGRIESFDNPVIESKEAVKKAVTKFITDMVKGEEELFKKCKINAKINWKFV